LHLMLWLDRRNAQGSSADEVSRRWLAIFPMRDVSAKAIEVTERSCRVFRHQARVGRLSASFSATKSATHFRTACNWQCAVSGLSPLESAKRTRVPRPAPRDAGNG